MSLPAPWTIATQISAVRAIAGPLKHDAPMLWSRSLRATHSRPRKPVLSSVRRLARPIPGSDVNHLLMSKHTRQKFASRAWCAVPVATPVDDLAVACPHG